MEKKKNGVCTHCGDRLNHDDDGAEECRWCSEGWKPSAENENTTTQNCKEDEED